MQDTRDTVFAQNFGDAQGGLDVLKAIGKWLGKLFGIAALMLAAVGAIALIAIKTNLI